MQQGTSRGGFSGKFGVFVAAVGSAVGLGNLWRFPYLVGENGGAAFIILYICFMAAFCLPVLIAEFVIGRRANRDVMGVFEVLAPRTPWKGIGVLGLAAALVILGFFCVIGGWTLAYTVNSLFPSLLAQPEATYTNAFQTLVESPVQPLFWTLLFIVMTALVVTGGVKNGIEKSCKILMPLLFVIVIILAIRALTLDTEMKGLKFLLQPDFSKVNGNTFLAALGQSFFSLSIGMGAMITYGSYTPKSTDITKTSAWVMSTDVVFSIIASLAVIPAVFAFGIAPGQGTGLVFITFPEIFSQLPFGNILSVIFFVLLAIAALTSAISLLEVLVAYLVDARGMSRRKAVTLMSLVACVLSVLASLSFGLLSPVKIFGKNFFESFDALSANILLPLGGFFICLFVGWYMKPADVRDELTNGGTIRVPFFNALLFVLRYVAPIAILLIFASSMGWL
jgi:NSS family neurotransmitter:Na+ symporter